LLRPGGHDRRLIRRRCAGDRERDLSIAPAVTPTTRDGPPLTEQLGATPDNATLWLLEARSRNVALPVFAIGWLWAPSTVTV